MKVRALELFAGTGGLGLGAGGVTEVVAAYDQDRSAAATYARNHPAPVRAIDLASVTAHELLRHQAPFWLLSPPCQPFTRRGRLGDADDRRAAGLLRLVELLPLCRPTALLVENVPGFHGSRAHHRLTDALHALGHETRDVVLCPSLLGAPVRRRREFVLASAAGLADLELPGPEAAVPAADFRDLLDPEPAAELAVPEALRQRLASRAARRSPLATFTRSYAHAITGAGPVLDGAGGLRYFSPGEILRFHGYPASFAFPPDLPLRTRFRLAGNSVHVGAVARLMRAFSRLSPVSCYAVKRDMQA